MNYLLIEIWYVKSIAMLPFQAMMMAFSGRPHGDLFWFLALSFDANEEKKLLMKEM